LLEFALNGKDSNYTNMVTTFKITDLSSFMILDQYFSLI